MGAAPGLESLDRASAGFWSWFPRWWPGFQFSDEWSAALLGFAGFALALGARRLGAAQGRVAWLGAAVLVQIALWFRTAPELRFGGGFFWIWCALGCALAIAQWLEPKHRLAAAGVLALVLCQGPLHRLTWRAPRSWKELRAHSLPVVAVEVQNGQRPRLIVYTAAAGPFASVAGIAPAEPIHGASAELLGDSPLPATLYPLPVLQWRVPGELRWGFRWKPPAENPGSIFLALEPEFRAFRQSLRAAQDH